MRGAVFVSIILLCAISPVILWAEDRQVVVGVVEWDSTENVVKGDSIGAGLIRRATARSLVILSAATGASEPDLSDQITVSPSLDTWKISIRRNLRFESGLPVTLKDVLYSINSCWTKRSANFIQSISSDEGSHTLVIRTAKGPESVREIQGYLSRCPIFEEHLGMIFGELLGETTIMPGVGEYSIEERFVGKVRLIRRSGVLEVPEVLEIREVSREGALSSLRSGRIDLLLGIDTKDLESASGDETIVPGKCHDFNYLARRGFKFTCSGSLNGIGYH